MTMNNTLSETTRFNSLLELQLRKEQLRNAIGKDGASISDKFKSLFAKPKVKQKRGFNMSSLVNTGAGALDGLVLAWKLYRKFHR